jgi:methyl-accepting chemotaxis protein
VGLSMSQMDTATQRNAALVEQSAAAAESLSAQAQELVQVVAAFRLAAA